DFGSSGKISNDFLMPVHLSTISQISQLKWVGYELLAITLCCIALLFLFYIYNCLLNPSIRRDTLFSFEKPSFSDIITCILFISATVSLGIIFTLRIAPSDANLVTPILSERSLADAEAPHSIFHI